MQNLKYDFNKTMMDNISDFIFIMTISDKNEFIYEYLNVAAFNETDYRENAIGKTLYEVNSLEKANFLHKHYHNVALNHLKITYKDSYKSKDNEMKYSETILIPLIDSKNNCTHIIAVVKDITTEVTVSTELEENKTNLKIITEYIDDLITLVDYNGDIIFASPSYDNILGLNHKNYLGKPFLYNVHSYDRIQVNKKMKAALKNKNKFSVKFRQLNFKDKWLWFEANGTPVFSSNGEFKHMAVVTRDISLQKIYEAELEYLALHDTLTGLPNRLIFMKRLKYALKNYDERTSRLAVFMLDIDDFKTINDTMGHDIGDEVIKEYGLRINKLLEKRNTFARIGGDEFTILLSHAKTADEVIEIAKEIQYVIEQPWNINKHTPDVTTSIGIAMINKQGITPSEILKDADDALYRAKREGKNTYRVK